MKPSHVIFSVVLFVQVIFQKPVAAGCSDSGATLAEPGAALSDCAPAPIDQGSVKSANSTPPVVQSPVKGRAIQSNYLEPVITLLEARWPRNRTVTIVCHGHSVPAGYFVTPVVDSAHAYPNLLREKLAKQFPHAVINVIVTAIGGEDSGKGAARFGADVLPLKPDVVLIDYALNDRRIGLDRAKDNWMQMIRKSQAAGVKVILLTPTPDQQAKLSDPADPLNQHAEQIRKLAAEYHVGLADSLTAFMRETANGTPLVDLMAQSNHPNARGHALVEAELSAWFSSLPASVSPGGPRSNTTRDPAP
ncbi:MAG: SGNH/GDSL hydrolase family protein [Verrucomicrobia bacterium]|nr:SGNH/GDSL hydrolase family protein [Verrucomicrobiota bacterium]